MGFNGYFFWHELFPLASCMLFLSSIFVKFGNGMCIRDDTESFLLAKSQWQNSFLSVRKGEGFVLFCFKLFVGFV